jgi:hypothetical protein
MNLRYFNFLSVFVLCLICSISVSAQLWTQDFETNGLGTAYTSVSVFTNNANAHYNRTNGANISNTYLPYQGQHGTFYWAGENQNDNTVGGDGLPNKVITFTNINVAGQTGLTFRGLFATGNQGAGYDYSDAFYVEYRMDAQPWVKCMQFATPSMSANVGLAYDANLDGLGEGASLTNVFKQFSANIPVTGTTLQLRITTINNSYGEEVAFDYLRVYSSNNPIVGCTNPQATNYNATAVVNNNLCSVPGCINPSALNFSPDANVDNGSCIYTVPKIVVNEIHYNPTTYLGYTDALYEFIELYNTTSTAVNISGWHMGRGIDYTFPQGATIPALGYVLLSPTAATYASSGATIYVYTGTLNNAGDMLELRNASGVLVDRAQYYPVNPWPINPNGNGPTLQLINPSMDNETAASWCGQGANNGTPGQQNSCYSPLLGCTNPLASNYNSSAQQDDGSCVILGCTYPSATNYSPTATTDNLSCTFNLVNPNAIHGCTYPSAINYMPTATVDDLSCTFNVVNPNAIHGCTYPSATNYMPTATVDDLSCTFNVVNPNVVLGCTYPSATNYMPTATVDDLSCTFNVVNPNVVLGCTYPSATNYMPAANVDDLSCVFEAVGPTIVPGCTYPSATNYMPTASVDDLSCIFEVVGPTIILGCTYPNATNFSPEANEDDLTCVFDFGTGSNCIGDLNGDFIVSVDDLSLFLAAFGSTCN